MSTLTTKWPTLLDVTQRLAGDGSVETEIVEALMQKTPILDDAPFYEANEGTRHKTTIRTGLPTGTWRKLNGGVQPTKSQAAPITFSTGMLEAYAEQDKALVDMQVNGSAFRKDEDMAHVQGMGHQIEQAMIYSDEATTPEQFTGLAKYLSDSTAESGANIIDGGGSGSDNTSIYLVGWGPRSVHGIYPRGSRGGVQMRDLGEVTVENVDGNNGRAQFYRTHFRWDVGLAVRDWRYVVRIANIDVSNLETLANTATLIDLMIEAEERIESLDGVRPVWYMNRNLVTRLRQGILQKVANNLTMENFNNRLMPAFNGVPIRRTDAILSTESAVSFA